VHGGVERGEPLVVHHERLDLSFTELRVAGVGFSIQRRLGLFQLALQVGLLAAQVDPGVERGGLFLGILVVRGVKAPDLAQARGDAGPVDLVERGAAMTSKTLAELLIDLGVAQSHSRPTISDDNPYSESQFKTMKYGASYPERFASLEAARAWMRWFANWYNHEHKHSGIALLPPQVVHGGQADEVLAKRQETLNAAYEAHPERFVLGRPHIGQLPKQVGINLARSTVEEPMTATSEAQPAATPGSRVSAAQRPPDPGDAVGQAVPEVLAVEVTNAPHFV
jgi:hypothetical protein